MQHLPSLDSQNNKHPPKRNESHLLITQQYNHPHLYFTNPSHTQHNPHRLFLAQTPRSHRRPAFDTSRTLCLLRLIRRRLPSRLRFVSCRRSLRSAVWEKGRL